MVVWAAEFSASIIGKSSEVEADYYDGWQEHCREIDFKFQERIGRGINAMVYRAYHYDSGRQVAIKVSAHEDDNMKKEARILRQVAGTGVPRLYCTLRVGEERNHALVMELIEGQSLYDAMKEGSKPYRLERLFVQPTMEYIITLVGLLHLHDYVHGDLKPENIMVDLAHDRFYLVDFGAAAPVGTRGVLGSPLFSPPEVFQGAPFEFVGDWYAVGIIFYELLTGGTPFASQSQHHLIQEKLRPIPRPHGLPNAAYDLLSWLTNPDPVKRPTTASEILKHHYFTYQKKCRTSQ